MMPEEEKNVQRRQRLLLLTRAGATLLIATGRGKVRAGIFSRHHLLTSGIKEGTCCYCVCKVQLRRLGVLVVDPNACGEEAGYDILRRSVVRMFPPAMAPPSRPSSTPPTATP